MDDNFRRLPAEIQVKIFNYVSRKVDLVECQLTCKLWSKHSTQTFYNDITFNNKNIGKANEFRKTLNKHGKDFKALVKHIKVGCSSDFENQYLTLLQFFADECPNIRTATLFGKTEDEFYKKELQHKNWKRLEAVRIGYYGVSRLPMEIAKQHQETIKELELYEFDIPILCDNKQEVKEQLANFKLLEKISIIINIPSHLSSLDNRIPKNVKSLTIELENALIEQNTVDPQNIDLREISPCPNIKELTLDLPLRDDNSIRYLMYKFPKLEKLSQRGDKIIFVSEGTKKAFTDYLLNIKKVDLIYTLVCDSISSTDNFFITKLVENSKVKKSKKYRNFTVCFETNDTFATKVQINKEFNNGVELYRISVGLEELQKLDFLKSFGADLTGLEVRKSDGDELDLNEIFKQCPNLKGLTIIEFDATLSEEVRENTMNLEILEYFGSERFTPEILAKWSTHFPNLTDLLFSGSEDTVIDLSSIITAFPNLVSLEIYNAELFLSNPDKKSYTVKKLSLNNCKLPTDGHSSNLFRCLPNVYDLKLRIRNGDLKSKQLILDMPETSLQNLSVCVNYYQNHQSTFLLKVSLPANDKETDSNKRYYVSTGYYKNMMKKCTEVDYESVTSESTDDLSTFQLTVNCKEFPRIVQRNGTCYKANAFML